MKPKLAQTKLGFKLRELCDKADPDNLRVGMMRRAADDLDMAAYSLGAKGPRVKQLSAYFTCLRYYRELAGVEYAD